MKTLPSTPLLTRRWQRARKFIGRWWPWPLSTTDPSAHKYIHNPVALGTQTLPCIVVLKPKQSTNDFYDQWGEG